jgi:integrase
MGKLTDVQCKKAKTEDKDVFLADGSGLYLRVRSGDNSAKVWLWRFKSPVTGSTRWFDLGSYPALSLVEARERAALLAAKRRNGVDPIEEERQADEAARVEAERQRKEAAAVAARMTVKALFEQWEKLELKGRKDRGREARRSFEKDVFPFIGDVAAEDIKRGMIAACLDRVVERGSPVLARALLSHLKQMFGFGENREYFENDPTKRLRRDDFGKKTERDRVLNDEEIRQLVTMLPESGLQEASQAAVWIMLATCSRVGEISQARWEHIDLEAGTWRIPPDNSKNGKEHTVFLSEFAMGHFRALQGLSAGSPWVLPASQKDGHIYLKSLTKQIADRQRGQEREPMAHRSRGTEALVLPRGKWTPHDLRRTGATNMGRLGVRPDVIEKCLNHTEQSSMVRTYQLQRLEAEQQEAWRLLGERLELLTGKRTNVVVMPAKAG